MLHQHVLCLAWAYDDGRSIHVRGEMQAFFDGDFYGAYPGADLSADPFPVSDQRQQRHGAATVDDWLGCKCIR